MQQSIYCFMSLQNAHLWPNLLCEKTIHFHLCKLVLLFSDVKSNNFLLKNQAIFLVAYIFVSIFGSHNDNDKTYDKV